MVNNGKMNIIYDNWKLVFHHDKLHDDNIIAKPITMIEVIMNRTTSKNEYFISDVNCKFILK